MKILIMPNISSAMEWNEGRNETREGRKRGREEGKARGGRRDTYLRGRPNESPRQSDVARRQNLFLSYDGWCFIANRACLASRLRVGLKIIGPWGKML